MLTVESCDIQHSVSPLVLGSPGDSIKPTAPQNLTAEATGQIFVDLKWLNTPSHRKGFRIYRDGLLINSISASDTETYADSDLDCRTRYFYTVTAFNDAGESDSSNIASATTYDCTPDQPTNLTAVVVAGNIVSLQWQDNSHNESFFWVCWTRPDIPGIRLDTSETSSDRSGSLMVSADTTETLIRVPMCGSTFRYIFNVQAYLVINGHFYSSWYSNSAEVRVFCN